MVKTFNEPLADRYPFNPDATQDASLDAFNRFFKPDGVLDSFYQAETLLNKETPLEALLTQLEDAKKQDQNTQTLEKQINERLDALSSR